MDTRDISNLEYTALLYVPIGSENMSFRGMECLKHVHNSTKTLFCSCLQSTDPQRWKKN